MIYGILLILLGLLAIPSLVLSKKPDAQKYFDKISPYQGWLGVIFAIWGIWGIINSVLTIGWIGTWPVYWITNLLVSLLEASLGFILGYSLIFKYVLSKKESFAAKGDQMLKKLMPLQGTLGIIAIILGIWQIIASIIWVVA